MLLKKSFMSSKLSENTNNNIDSDIFQCYYEDIEFIYTNQFVYTNKNKAVHKVQEGSKRNFNGAQDRQERGVVHNCCCSKKAIKTINKFMEYKDGSKNEKSTISYTGGNCI
ncbi:hypothetical protein SPACI_001590 [Sporomusa acidovorans DSM 3132]|uniref:Uncharacterized protein n=1 Tax=Sporomusa acidovorans (strain ATCC 49682 / DSM 3132 / Mol) TaxID=1123286 RepID=A0ABZ3IWM7_SPOA4|nr:hypothetical protein SPACI_04140 [Sporomusa acidovorans DSM 3132]SDF54059.1 hypothetical protein SAMN04488499_10572 [Sporomusa acidovorans]